MHLSIYTFLAFILIATFSYAVYVATAIIAHARDTHTQSIIFYYHSRVYILKIHKINKKVCVCVKIL